MERSNQQSSFYQVYEELSVAWAGGVRDCWPKERRAWEEEDTEPIWDESIAVDHTSVSLDWTTGSWPKPFEDLYEINIGVALGEQLPKAKVPSVHQSCEEEETPTLNLRFSWTTRPWAGLSSRLPAFLSHGQPCMKPRQSSSLKASSLGLILYEGEKRVKSEVSS